MLKNTTPCKVLVAAEHLEYSARHLGKQPDFIWKAHTIQNSNWQVKQEKKDRAFHNFQANGKHISFMSCPMNYRENAGMEMVLATVQIRPSSIYMLC